MHTKLLKGAGKDKVGVGTDNFVRRYRAGSAVAPPLR